MSIISVLGESAVRSLALAVAVAIVLRVVRVQHARLAKRAWTAVLVLSLAMPALVALHIPSFSFVAPWSAPRTVIVPAINSAATPSVTAVNALLLDAADRSSAISAALLPPEGLVPTVALHVPVPTALQTAPHGAPAPARHIVWWQIGFIAYLVITSLLVLRVLLGLTLAARLWRRAQTFTISETDLPARLSVRLSVDLRSPATVGHGILLPLEAIEWDDTALRATLAHEAQHIREGDFYLQLAATLHHCFFWISPHAWWLRPQLSRLSETICDRAAIASSGDGLSYAQLLVRFATAEQAPAGMVAMAQSAGLRERVEHLIADPQLSGAFRDRRGQAILAAGLFAVAAVIAAASIHIVQPRTIVLAALQVPAPPASPAPAPETAPAPDAAPAPQTVPAPPSANGNGVGSDAGIATGDGSGTGDSFAPVLQLPPADVAPAPDVVAVPPMPPGDAIVAPVMPVFSVMPVTPVVSVHPLVITGVNANVTGVNTNIDALAQIEMDSPEGPNSHSYAIYGPDGGHSVMMHDWFGDSDKLKDEHAKHPGGAILFRRDGKTWIIDNPALVKRAQDAYAHVNALAKQQGELGGRQGELGARQGELGALQGELGAKQGEWGDMQSKFAEDFKFDMPKDFDKDVSDMAELSTKLALEGDSMSESQRAVLEAQSKEAKERFDKAMAQIKAQEPQREAMEKQMRDQAEHIRKEMEPLIQQMRELGEKQGELGRLQGELGRQQGLLGRQQRQASREADRQVQSLIDQAMKDGKAHPVQ